MRELTNSFMHIAAVIAWAQFDGPFDKMGPDEPIEPYDHSLGAIKSRMPSIFEETCGDA